MDIKALSTTFDYSKLGSIYEKRQTLLSKIYMVDSKLDESDLKNHSY